MLILVFLDMLNNFTWLSVYLIFVLHTKDGKKGVAQAKVVYT